MIQSSHRFGLDASSPNLSESSLAGGLWGLAPNGRPTEPNLIQTNLATKRRDQNGGLIESCPRLKFSITQLVDFMWNDPENVCYILGMAADTDLSKVDGTWIPKDTQWTYKSWHMWWRMVSWSFGHWKYTEINQPAHIVGTEEASNWTNIASGGACTYLRRT